MFKTIIKKDNIDYLTYIKEVIDRNITLEITTECRYTLNLRSSIDASIVTDIAFNYEYVVKCLHVEVETLETFNRKRKIKGLCQKLK